MHGRERHQKLRRRPVVNVVKMGQPSWLEALVGLLTLPVSGSTIERP
jgi:hypothetical protein